MTAEELIEAAAACLRCGREHERRVARDHRGSPFVTRSSPADGHMPIPLDAPFLAALRRVASTPHPAAAAITAPGADDETPEPAAARTAPRSRKPRTSR